MEWLKDPKNQPKVAIGLSVFIVLMLVVGYFLYFRPPAAPQSTETSAPVETAPQGDIAPTTPTPPPTAAPAAPAAQPAVNQVVSSTPTEAWRDDPFMPMGYKPPKTPRYKPKPPITDFPFFMLPSSVRVKPPPPPELVQPSRRMAGILVNSRVYAIIETNGESEIVQPGDTLKDRLAVVEKIERDKILLKTKDVKPRYITVRMAASPRAPTGVSDTGMPSGGPDTGPVTRPSTGRPGRNGRAPMGPEGDFN
jgi:hypothetical protein